MMYLVDANVLSESTVVETIECIPWDASITKDGQLLSWS